jgi:hypothetical protein
MPRQGLRSNHYASFLVKMGVKQIGVSRQGM